MDISELSPVQKSVMLARLVNEWEVIERVDYARICKRDRVGPCLFEMHKNHNLYTVDGDGNPHLMAWAWRVLNWAAENQTTIKGAYIANLRVKDEMYDWLLYDGNIWDMPPADAQTLWLDKILSLAIEAGLVETAE